MGFGLNPGIPVAGDTELATEAKQDETNAKLDTLIANSASAYETRNDPLTDPNLIYLGKAAPGSATSSAVWQIKRYNKSAGHSSFADDETTFDKVWDDRTTYSY